MHNIVFVVADLTTAVTESWSADPSPDQQAARMAHTSFPGQLARVSEQDFIVYIDTKVTREAWAVARVVKVIDAGYDGYSRVLADPDDVPSLLRTGLMMMSKDRLNLDGRAMRTHRYGWADDRGTVTFTAPADVFAG